MGEEQRPVLRRRSGEPRPFQRQGLRPWVAFGLLALALSAWLPVTWAATAPLIERTNPLLSLFFMLAAIGHWLRLRRRAFAVAGVLTAFLYVLTAWSPAVFGYEDFFAIALISSFLVFALAGFNLVFILEEMVFDAQRLVGRGHTAWRFGPTAFVLVLAWTLPFLPGPTLLAMWITSILSMLLLGGWWFVRAFNTLSESGVLRELHLIVGGGLAIAAVLDAIRLLPDASGLFPSALAYGLLVATWLYVSFTTLQRTSFLLQARDAVPWLLILLSAAFALVHHALLHYRVEGGAGMTVLLNQRLLYLVVGIAVGMVFYLGQAAWRVLGDVRDNRQFGPGGRIMAGRFARLAEELVATRQRLIGGTRQIYVGVDSLLPRRHQGWELDVETGTVRSLDEESDEIGTRSLEEE